MTETDNSRFEPVFVNPNAQDKKLSKRVTDFLLDKARNLTGPIVETLGKFTGATPLPPDLTHSIPKNHEVTDEMVLKSMTLEERQQYDNYHRLITENRLKINSETPKPTAADKKQYQDLAEFYGEKAKDMFERLRRQLEEQS